MHGTPAAGSFEDDVRRGDLAWAAGQVDTALYMYVLALQRSPNDALTLAKIGEIHQSQGHIEIAIQAFELAHAADPKEPRIAERLGLLYLRMGRVNEAEALFKAALAADPSRWQALDGMAEVARLHGSLDRAMAYEDRALQGKGVNPTLVLEHRGHIELLLGRLSGAEADLRASIRMLAQPDAYRYLAEVQVREHDNAGAYESLTKTMGVPAAYDQLGLMLMSVHDYRAAADYFEKAISASPNRNESAEKNLSIAQEKLAQPAGNSSAIHAKF